MRPPIQTDPGAEYCAHQQLTLCSDIPEFAAEGEGQAAANQNQWDGFGDGLFQSIETAEGVPEDFHQREQRVDSENQKNDADGNKSGCQ